MKKIYLAATSLLALSQSASAGVNCMFGCSASACGSSEKTFKACFEGCGGTVLPNGNLKGDNISNCIKAAEKAGFTKSLANDSSQEEKDHAIAKDNLNAARKALQKAENDLESTKNSNSTTLEVIRKSNQETTDKLNTEYTTKMALATTAKSNLEGFKLQAEENLRKIEAENAKRLSDAQKALEEAQNNITTKDKAVKETLAAYNTAVNGAQSNAPMEASVTPPVTLSLTSESAAPSAAPTLDGAPAWTQTSLPIQTPNVGQSDTVNDVQSNAAPSAAPTLDGAPAWTQTSLPIQTPNVGHSDTVNDVQSNAALIVANATPPVNLANPDLQSNVLQDTSVSSMSSESLATSPLTIGDLQGNNAQQGRTNLERKDSAFSVNVAPLNGPAQQGSDAYVTGLHGAEYY